MTRRAIYVASLNDYNAGTLHGCWIEMDYADIDEVSAVIASMLRQSRHPNVRVVCPNCEGTGRNAQDDIRHEASRIMGGIAERPPSTPCPSCGGRGTVPSAEEYAVHDYDGIPDMGEHPNLVKVIEVATLAEEHGETWEAFVAAFGIHYILNLDDIEEFFSESCAGSGTSERDWVIGYVEDSGLLSGVSEEIARYFDYDLYLRDLKAGGAYTFARIGGTVYAFTGD